MSNPNPLDHNPRRGPAYNAPIAPPLKLVASAELPITRQPSSDLEPTEAARNALQKLKDFGLPGVIATAATIAMIGMAYAVRQSSEGYLLLLLAVSAGCGAAVALGNYWSAAKKSEPWIRDRDWLTATGETAIAMIIGINFGLGAVTFLSYLQGWGTGRTEAALGILGVLLSGYSGAKLFLRNPFRKFLLKFYPNDTPH